MTRAPTSCFRCRPARTRWKFNCRDSRPRLLDVVLQVGQPQTLNVELALGQTTDVVNVLAETTTINTENATVGNPFTEKQVVELPLQTRNVVALLSQQPGVVIDGAGAGSQGGSEQRDAGWRQRQRHAGQRRIQFGAADSTGFSSGIPYHDCRARRRSGPFVRRTSVDRHQERHQLVSRIAL